MIAKEGQSGAHGSHRSLASMTLEIVRLTLAASSVAPGTDRTAAARSEEESDRRTHRQRAGSWGSVLSAGETTRPSQVQRVYDTEWIGEAWLVHMAEQEDRVYGIPPHQGGRLSYSW